MMLREKMLPCQSREALVTVMSYHDGIMDGCLQHPRLDGKEKVRSLSEMILLLNSLLDGADGLYGRKEQGGISYSDSLPGTLYLAGQTDLAERETRICISQCAGADSASG